jgi:hypothetical protein
VVRRRDYQLVLSYWQIHLSCFLMSLQGKFSMKFSIVKPIYKKGEKTNPTNYRPISLLTSFSKVFEKALYTRLTDHFNTYKLLVGKPVWFQKKHSNWRCHF